MIKERDSNGFNLADKLEVFCINIIRLRSMNNESRSANVAANNVNFDCNSKAI